MSSLTLDVFLGEFEFKLYTDYIEGDQPRDFMGVHKVEEVCVSPFTYSVSKFPFTYTKNNKILFMEVM